MINAPDPLPEAVLWAIHRVALAEGLTRCRHVLLPDPARRERIPTAGSPSDQLFTDLQTLHREVEPDGRRPHLERWLRAAAQICGARQAAQSFSRWAELAGARWSAPPEGDASGRAARATQTEIEQLVAERDALRESGASDELVGALSARIIKLKRTRLHPRRPEVGLTLSDRWTLVEKVGRGGFAEVWRSHDSATGHAVAVKLLHSQFDDSAERRARFFRGARQMARLAHPHVVRVIAPRCTDRGFHFFVMEWLAGGDLERTMLEGRIDREHALSLVLEVGEALVVAHAQGLVHRDVKPANILLDGAGRAKLTDFDLVRVDDSSGGTRTGGMGTFIYAAPEAMEAANSVSPTCDVYSLGMCALFVLRGARLGPRVIYAREKALRRAAGTDRVKDVIRRAIAIEPDQRYPSMAECLAALRAAAGMRAGTEATETAPTEIWQPTRSIARVMTNATERRPAMLRVPVYPSVTFIVGSPADEIGRWPEEAQRVVRLTRGFWMAETPVTQGQYAAVCGSNTAYFQGSPADSERPVERVTWLDAIHYCNALSSIEGLTPAYVIRGGDVEWLRGAAGYRLPTEVEWEYAARAGTVSATYAGDLDIVGENHAPLLDAIAWYGGNSGSSHPRAWVSSAWTEKHYAHDRASTQRVKRKAPNGWGLYDMLGNVLEWTWDRWSAEPEIAPDGEAWVDPAGPLSGERRVIRGGSFGASARNVRAAFRGRGHPENRGHYVGFRVVRTVNA